MTAGEEDGYDIQSLNLHNKALPSSVRFWAPLLLKTNHSVAVQPSNKNGNLQIANYFVN